MNAASKFGDQRFKKKNDVFLLKVERKSQGEY